jgi:Protein of unknown function (DUF3891)
MILRREEQGVLAIGQLSHSWISGQLARVWGNERFLRPEPAEEISLGAEQHDVGWASFDLHPGFNPGDGLPRTFLETSIEEHLTIWSDAPDRLLSASSHAALVASLHGSALSRLRRRVADDVETFLLDAHIAAERDRQSRLREQLGLTEQQTEVMQQQMWAWDGISLALCNGWEELGTSAPTAGGSVDLVLTRSAGEEFLLDPWPFSSPSVEVRCEARRLADSYETKGQMQEALEAAAPIRLSFRLAPSSG